MPTLAETVTLAAYLHEGVTDWTGAPYIGHPIWVMNALPPQASDDDRAVALLHDTVEDCPQRIAELMRREMGVDAGDIHSLFAFYPHRGYSQYVVDGLRLLTRDLWQPMSYLDYIRQIAASGHRGAIWAKYGDNLHNSDPERLGHVLSEFQTRAFGLQDRYEKSKAILRPAVTGLGGNLDAATP